MFLSLTAKVDGTIFYSIGLCRVMMGIPNLGRHAVSAAVKMLVSPLCLHACHALSGARGHSFYKGSSVRVKESNMVASMVLLDLGIFSQ